MVTVIILTIVAIIHPSVLPTPIITTPSITTGPIITTPTTPMKPAKPATTAAPAEEEGGSSLGPAIGGAVGGLIVVIAIAYFIIQKKRVDPNSQGLVDAAGEGVVESVQSTARGSGFTFAFRS